MNSGCAVVASHAIGAVPFMIKNSENGMVYKNGNLEELYSKVKFLIDNPQERNRLAKAAYYTVLNEWNGEVAAKRLYELSKNILIKKDATSIYNDGPCSNAKSHVNSYLKNREGK